MLKNEKPNSQHPQRQANQAANNSSGSESSSHSHSHSQQNNSAHNNSLGTYCKYGPLLTYKTRLSKYWYILPYLSILRKKSIVGGMTMRDNLLPVSGSEVKPWGEGRPQALPGVWGQGPHLPDHLEDPRGTLGVLDDPTRAHLGDPTRAHHLIGSIEDPTRGLLQPPCPWDHPKPSSAHLSPCWPAAEPKHEPASPSTTFLSV